MAASDWTPDPTFAIESSRLVISHFIPESTTHCQCIIDTYSSPTFKNALGSLASAVDTIEQARAIINGRFRSILALYGYGHFLVSVKTGSTIPDSGATPTWDASAGPDGRRPVGIISLVLSRPEYPPNALPCPDIGFAFTEDAMGKGYALEASIALIKYARANWGVKDVIGITQPANLRSQRVLEKLGLEKRGVMNLRAFPGKESVVYASSGVGEDFAPYRLDGK